MSGLKWLSRLSLRLRLLLLTLVLASGSSWAQSPSGPAAAGSTERNHTPNDTRLSLAETCVSISGADASPPAHARCSPVEATLPFRWDESNPGESGSARFTFRWTRSAADGELPTLLLPAAGNGLVVALNDRVLLQVGAANGSLDANRVDAGKRPWLVPLPPERLLADNTITVTLLAAAGRAAQLQPPQLGSFAAMQAAYDREHLWRVESTRTLMWIAVLIGAICLVMATIQRDALFAACGVAHLSWALRLAETFWVQTPLPWPIWSAVMATVFTLTQAALAYFFLHASDRWNATWRKGFAGFAAAWFVVVPVIVATGSTTLWLAWLALTIGGFVGTTVFVARVAFREKLFWRWLLVAWAVTSLAAGLADVMASPGSVYVQPLWSRFAVALFSLALVTLIARQLREAFEADRQHARELRQALSKQEKRLQALHEEDARREVDRATWSERQRLMRDMHDGLGAQLYGLHALAGRPESARRELQGQIRQAIEELRLVVDAMNPFDGDLAAMLGDLRPPLERRLALSQVELRWAVEELPTIPDFSPAKVQHLKRLLLEAATNIARHSGATEARLAASTQDGVFSVEFSDNGRGFDPDSPKAGNGLRNMRWRAMMIGAQFAMESRNGCHLRLKMPLTALKASATPLASMSAPSAPAAQPTNAGEPAT
jgi:signal transduction histidine kinase